MVRLTVLILALAFLAAPAGAQAAAQWTCSSGAGWVAAGGQRADAPGVGGDPCPVSAADAGGATGPGSLAATGTASVDGGSGSQTTDTRSPKAELSAKSLTIHNPDGKLTLTASNLDVVAGGSCDANRHPSFTSGGSFGTVTLNGKSVDTSRDYSEPGVGVNGAPLFGKITIHFSELAKSDNGLSRQAIHLVVTDRNGATVFEAVAGIVAVGRDGSVCDPPPVCPPGQEQRGGQCVAVTVTPLPDPTTPAPAPAPSPSPTGPPPGGAGSLPSGGGGTSKPPTRQQRGCANADARPGSLSSIKLASAALCLMNVERKQRHLKPLRANKPLARVALQHARDMVNGGYFAHDEPSGRTFLDRVLHSGYLARFGKWSIGENLGWGRGSLGSPRAMVIAWMHSPEHRRNILDRKFRDVGVSATSGTPGLRSSGTTYVVDFGGFQLIR